MVSHASVFSLSHGAIGVYLLLERPLLYTTTSVARGDPETLVDYLLAIATHTQITTVE